MLMHENILSNVNFPLEPVLKCIILHAVNNNNEQSIKIVSLSIRGIRPMIMHNGRLVNPSDEYVLQIKRITSKGSKKLTDADYAERDRLEWEGSFYYDDKIGPYIPSDNIERCIQLGAQKSRLGKDFAAGLFCDQDIIPLQYDGPRDLDALYKDSRFRIVRSVRVQNSRIMRIRPLIPSGWSLNLKLDYDDSILNERSVLKAIADAGTYCGLGDWRPKFGRFVLEA